MALLVGCSNYWTLKAESEVKIYFSKELHYYPSGKQLVKKVYMTAIMVLDDATLHYLGSNYIDYLYLARAIEGCFS